MIRTACSVGAFCATILSAPAAAPAAAAGEQLVVEVPVDAVEPVTSTEQITEARGDCTPARPADDDLGAWLAWDLRPDCRLVPVERTHVTGWRVRWTLDGRSHERVVAERPGSRMTLRVRLE